MDNHPHVCIMENHPYLRIMENHPRTLIMENHPYVCIAENHPRLYSPIITRLFLSVRDQISSLCVNAEVAGVADSWFIG